MSGIGGSVEQMTQGHLRNVQQLAVFYTGHNNIYAINIAKIKAFIITEEITINESPTESPVIAGIATIRGEPVTLINLDTWLGSQPLEMKDYHLIIYCEFSNKKVSFLIKDMINIVEKTTDELKPTQETNSKITYTTYVNVNGKDELCTVFNAEQLLTDIGWNSEGKDNLTRYATERIHSDKIILAAEDSGVAREVLIEFFEKTSVKYEIFNNGKQLLEKIQTMDKEDIGLVLTDIEMPEVDGYQVAQFVKDRFASVPVVVNSSMTTDAVRHKMEIIGVDGFVGKGDIQTLYSLTKKFLN